MSTAPHLQDEQLSGRTIRLLSIQPASNEEDEVECTCSRHDLDNAPPFEALSYVWGSQDHKIQIKCNDAPVMIGRNLAEALQRLRRPDNARTIWVDALCIDQESTQEKNHQVPLMTAIYPKAFCVIIWLGYQDQLLMATEEAVRGIAYISNACRKSQKHNQKKFTISDTPHTLWTPTFFDSLRALYAHAYFSRIWCIQEVVLSQSAIVFWGCKKLPWIDVGATAGWIFYERYKVVIGDSPRAGLQTLHVCAAAKMFRFHTFPLQNLSDLLSILRAVRPWKSTDPRDKVYGISGLLRSDPTRELVEVNYSRSMYDVMADAARLCIFSSGLRVLGHVNHGEVYVHVNGSRSWAPNWSSFDPYWYKLSSESSQSRWCPDGSRDVKSRFDSGVLSSLTSFGFRYSSVESISDIMKYNDMMQACGQDANIIHPFVRSWELFGSPNMKDWQENHESAKVCTTMARTLSPIRYSLLEASSRYRSEHDFIVSFIEWMQVLLDRRSPCLNHDFKSSSRFTRNDEAMIHTICHGRRCFVTRDGTYGLGPACMRPGDVIVVLFGASMPSVLRPHGENYLFMGEAYIDCIMHGELVEQLERGDIQEREFCLV